MRSSPLCVAIRFSATYPTPRSRLSRALRYRARRARNNDLPEGDKADDLYVLIEGALLVYSFDDLGREIALARLSEPDRIVGEQALLTQDGTRRSASVRAISQARLPRVPGGAFKTPDARSLLAQLAILAQQIRLKVPANGAIAPTGDAHRRPCRIA